MARAELGNKHTCVDCGVKFYDLNKLEIICPACGKEVKLTSDDQQVQLQAKETPVVDEIIQDETELKPEKESLDNNLEDGVIEDDNPIIMDDDILDDESEEELINENDIDIPDIENEELIEDDDNDFLVEEDDIEESDLIITPKRDDE